MPWNEWRYPAAMQHLDPPTRMKAIEIAKGKEWAMRQALAK